jgi:hypothetical protein
MGSIRVLGVRVDDLDVEGTLDRIEELLAAGGHHLVATVNPEFVMLAQRDPEFRRLLEGAAGLRVPRRVPRLASTLLVREPEQAPQRALVPVSAKPGL